LTATKLFSNKPIVGSRPLAKLTVSYPGSQQPDCCKGSAADAPYANAIKFGLNSSYNSTQGCSRLWWV
jgi:hypothetical protein